MEAQQPEVKPTFEGARFGIFTASELHRLLKKGSGKDEYWGEGAITYLNEKIAELITGEKKRNVDAYSLEWGRSNESDAVSWFALVTGKKVTHYGGNEFKFYNFNDVSGGSPDGEVDGMAALEVKCPLNSSNHIEYLLNVDKGAAWLKSEHFDYYVQCTFNAMCMKHELCYFASYDPRTISHEHRMAKYDIPLDKQLEAEIKERIDKAKIIIQDALKQLDKSPQIK